MMSSSLPVETLVSTDSLGEFEQLVLLAVLHLRRVVDEDDDVYGIPILAEIEARTGRAPARAAVYVTLRRLERKGLLSSWMGSPRPERGGKARRCVDITPEGEAALLGSRRALDRMWGALAPAIRDPE
jgi:DNA-binding PadR family transcriptional regulator